MRGDGAGGPRLAEQLIASELRTTEITVKIRRASVMKKMQAVSLADLVRFAEKLSIDGEEAKMH